MMHKKGRDHVTKRREELREFERQIRAVQPKPGEPIGGATAGVGRPPSGAGNQHRSVNQVAQAGQAADTVRLPAGAITERQIRAWREAEAVPPTRPQGKGVGQRDRDIPKLTMKQRLARWAGTKAGRAMARRAEDTKVSEQKFSLGTAAGKKGGWQCIVTVASLVAAFGLIRGFAPGVLWSEEQDAVIAQKVMEGIAAVGAVATFIAWVIGTAKNIWKNWGLVKNGVSITKTIVLLCAFGFMSGCAITTPKGVYSLALTGDQVGFAKDVVAQVGNLYLEIEAQEAALVQAEQDGKADRVAAILERIANLKAKAAEKSTVVQDEIEAAQEVLAESPS